MYGRNDYGTVRLPVLEGRKVRPPKEDLLQAFLWLAIKTPEGQKQQQREHGATEACVGTVSYLFLCRMLSKREGKLFGQALQKSKKRPLKPEA